MVLIWFLSANPGAPPGAVGPAIDYSYAGMIGRFLEPVMRPVGFDWAITLALIPAFAAREVVVATLGTIYAVAARGARPPARWGTRCTATGPPPPPSRCWPGSCSRPSAPPRSAWCGGRRASWVWPTVMVAYMSALAYAAAFLAFHLATAALG